MKTISLYLHRLNKKWPFKFGFGVNCIIVTLYRCLPDHIYGGGSRLHVYVNEFIALNSFMTE